ncbi:MAG TPA: alpha/beta hydrolase [Bacillus bacterium]|nr:alpha/beta hydrolase [Bacillus sp. (in: firmicutes)]
MALNKTYIELENIRVYCEYSLNNKPPLMLIHGVAATIYTFNALMPLLKDHFSIVAVDLPGFGRSEKSSSFVYSFENYAKVVQSFIEYFQLKDVTIVGHSMGGQIALYTAKLFPEKINKLVLLASSGYLKPANKALIYCTYLPFFKYFIKREVLKKEVKDVLKNVFYNPSLITNRHIEEFGNPLKEEGFYTSLMRLLRHREGDLSSGELQNIYIPTLLLWGEEDKVVPVEVGHRLAKDLPNAKLLTYEKTGHLISEEKPKEVFKEVLSFIFERG